MLDKILLISKKEEAGIIVISRMIAVFSILFLSADLLFSLITRSFLFLGMGIVFLPISFIINSIFLVGILVKFFQKKSDKAKCLLSALYLLVALIVGSIYDQIVGIHLLF